MRSSMSKVQVGVESARSAGEGLTGIIHGAESVQKLITRIAAAAAEQSYATQSVSSNVSEIAEAVRQTAAKSERSATASKQLSCLADELNVLVNSFKVGAENGTGPGIAQKADAACGL